MIAALRRRRLAGLLLAAAVLTLGCNPFLLPYFMFPFDNKFEPECKLTSPDKETRVVILVSTGPETRPELIRVDREMTVRLTQVLQQRFKENKEKVVMAYPSKVENFKDKHPQWRSLSPFEVGKKMDTDYVINLEINSMSLYESGLNQLFRGRAEISVSVTDLSKLDGESTVFSKEYSTEYPSRGPKDVNDSNPQQFRSEFMMHIAKDLSRFFSSYPTDEKYDLD
jgi:hypothetical protein